MTQSEKFVGSFSNFHQDILSEITPQITNNCSESLNASLKKFFTSGYNPKYKVAEGIRNFYEQKRLHLVTFEENKKIRNRKKKDLEKFRKLKVLSQHLSTLMSLQGIPEDYIFERFYEIAFKIGHIHSPRLNELYEEINPNFLNIFQDL